MEDNIANLEKDNHSIEDTLGNHHNIGGYDEAGLDHLISTWARNETTY